MPVARCPNCRKPVTVPSGSSGKKARCPHCTRSFIIAHKAHSAGVSTKPAPTHPLVVNAPAATAVLQRKTKRKTISRRQMTLAAGAGVAVLAVVGVVLLVRGRSAPPPSQPADPVPVAEIPKPRPIHVPKTSVPPLPTSGPSPTPNPNAVEPKPGVSESPIEVSTQQRIETLLARLNGHRTAAKVPPVSIDADLARGCQAHADYLIANRNHPSLSSAAGVQDENESLPGFSAEGQKAASASLMAFADPISALEIWIGRLNSRPPILHPDLERIGVGAARTPRGEWVTVLDPTRGHAVVAIPFPSPGQTDVPLTTSGGPEADGDAGFPVSLQFPTSKSPAAVDAHLADDRGNRVPVLLSTPESPLPGVRRPGLIGMIPKSPLAPNSTYSVHVACQVDGRDFVKDWKFTTEDDADRSGQIAARVVRRLNAIRRQAELQPVELDDELSRGCRMHARYLVVNARRPEVRGMGAHAEIDTLPGASPEGAKTAKSSVIAIGDYEPSDAVDGWMSTLYHRIPVLEPGLRKVGFGAARGARLGWVTVVDISTGRDKSPRAGAVYWPVAGQTDVPLHFPPGGETPDPIPLDKTGRAGYPITAFYPFQLPLMKSTGRLQDSQGRDVPCWFSSPEQPANPMFVKHQGTTVCLIPKEPLKPKETYRATFEGQIAGDAVTKSWTFTTGDSGSDSDAVQKALARLNQVRGQAGLPAVVLDPALSRGCQRHAEYVVRNSGQREKKDFRVVDEDPSLPGYTKEGQAAAQRSDVFSFAPSPTTQIDDLAGTLYRRSFVLEPRLRRVGLGCAYETGVGWVNVLDLSSGRDDGAPVIFPGVDQDGVPIMGRDRYPGSTSTAGFPITVWFPGRPTITNVRAVLTETGSSTNLETLVSWPESPFDPSGSQVGAIAIHPRHPFRFGRSYSIFITADVNGVPWQHNARFKTTRE